MAISLERVSSVALTIDRRLPSRRSAFASSVAVVASLAVLVGIGCIGLSGAILAGAALVTLWFTATHSRWVQCRLERLVAQRARARRDSDRRDALCATTAARRTQYRALRELVEVIEGADPVTATGLELQGLLDYFVQLAVGHQRCMESLRVSEGAAPQANPVPEGAPSPRRCDIATRRLRHREETAGRLGQIADELDAADSFIRLVAQRRACADLDTMLDGESEIDRRLADLDEVEAAIAQISA